MKLCIKCKKTKDTNCFHKDHRRKDGFFPYCKDCRRKITGSKKIVHKKIGEMDGFIIVERDRYPEILLPTGSMRVHRYVIEKLIGRKLKHGEVVHHIDGDKKNWKEANLVLMTDKRHRVMEGHINKGYSPKIKCHTCGKERTYSNYHVNKTLNKKLYQCKECYYKNGGAGGRHKLLNAGPEKN